MVTSHHNNMPVQRRQAPDAVPAHTSTFDPWRHSLIPNVFLHVMEQLAVSPQPNELIDADRKTFQYQMFDSLNIIESH